MQLNASQREVVATRDKRVLVLAGAGTGKTATSVQWVASRVREGVPRSAIMMITFTRKAAHEMATRVERLVKDVPKKSKQDALLVGTYHAVASILLRRDAEGFGLLNRNFTTLDESESQSVWKSALKQCGHGAKSPLHIPAKLGSLYSLARNTCENVERTMANAFGGDAAGELGRIVAQYEELKAAANVVDYDDLLVKWAERMERDEAYADKLRGQYRYVLVDEMQDNNQLNQRLLDAMNPEHLLVVGDANQSIYGFRGSDVSLILNFPRRNPGARTLKLEDNYRSGQPILDLANTIVSSGEASLQLRSAKKVGAEARVEYRMYLSPQDEAEGVIGWINRRLSDGRRGCDCAILARGSKIMTALEVTLRTHKIPYKKYGGLTLADAAEVRDFISFLRVAHNSHDKIALLRALTQFPGVGEGTAAKAIAARQEEGLFQDEVWPRAASQLPIWLHRLRQPATIGEKGRYLFEQFGDIVRHNYPKDGEERLGTINTLVNSMEQLNISLAEFLDGFSIDRATDNRHPNECVTLSTVHSAKGLEWDGVWVCGAGSTQLPHPRAQEKDEIEEERRLFYVAVTRAKHHLVISYPQLNDKRQGQKPTMFLPPDCSWRFCRD